MTRKTFPPTELDLALAADPVAEANRIALLVAAGEVPAPSSAVSSSQISVNSADSKQRQKAKTTSALEKLNKAQLFRATLRRMSKHDNNNGAQAAPETAIREVLALIRLMLADSPYPVAGDDFPSLPASESSPRKRRSS